MIWNYLSVGIVLFEFVKIKGAKIILNVKSTTFMTAKLKGSTVLPCYCDIHLSHLFSVAFSTCCFQSTCTSMSAVLIVFVLNFLWQKICLRHVLDTNHISGWCRALSQVCVLVWMVTFEGNDFWARYSEWWVTLTLIRSASEVIVQGQRMEKRRQLI